VVLPDGHPFVSSQLANFREHVPATAWPLPQHPLSCHGTRGFRNLNAAEVGTISGGHELRPGRGEEYLREKKALDSMPKSFYIAAPQANAG